MREERISEGVLLILGVILIALLVGYNAFLLPDHEPATASYLSTETPAEPALSDSEKTEPTDLVVNLNTADAQELQQVPGIGPVLADAILDYRDTVGVFININELLEVKGIGQSTLEKIAPYFVLE